MAINAEDFAYCRPRLPIKSNFGYYDAMGTAKVLKQKGYDHAKVNKNSYISQYYEITVENTNPWTCCYLCDGYLRRVKGMHISKTARVS